MADFGLLSVADGNENIGVFLNARGFAVFVSGDDHGFTEFTQPIVERKKILVRRNDNECIECGFGIVDEFERFDNESGRLRDCCGAHD